jgi:hypothetical protein
VTEPIFGTTELAISISSQIPMIQNHVVLEHTPYFTVAPSYHVTQMLSDQYSTMNPTRKYILPTYLGNYGLSYVGNDNIPNPWTMILNHYYLGNHPFTFSNTHEHVAYSFLNMVCIEIATIGGSQGVHAFMMTPLVIDPTSGFSTKNPVPYFQLPT